MNLHYKIIWARIFVRVTIYRRLRIVRDGHLDQSGAYDIWFASVDQIINLGRWLCLINKDMFS